MSFAVWSVSLWYEGGLVRTGNGYLVWCGPAGVKTFCMAYNEL